MASHELDFDDLEYDPSAFDDINPNDLDVDALEAELAKEEAALHGKQENVEVTEEDPKLDTESKVAEAEGTEVSTKVNADKAGSSANSQAVKSPPRGNSKSIRHDQSNNANYRPNRRSNERPNPYMMGNFPQMGGVPGLPPMVGMGMPPFPMMGFQGAQPPGMMNFPSTIHINPKFAGNAKIQQEMMMMQQQQWQQAMAYQQANAMGMPFFNNNPQQQQQQQPRFPVDIQKPHGPQRPLNQVCFVNEKEYSLKFVLTNAFYAGQSSSIDDANAKNKRERTIPNGHQTKRRLSQETTGDKKRHQSDKTSSISDGATASKGFSIKGASTADSPAPNPSSPSIAHPAVVGGKSSRLVISNLASSIPEAELHRLGKVVPGGVKALLIDRPAGKATLSFQTIDAAVTFRRKYNRTSLAGQHITVSFA
ncbi:hypothetical protein INT43_000698 [Umbelopsis isabellina]|uniref:RRM domain-containing protein n=1 Tax=Mortierella isabellina TaxID=91625 RepID=A0A8H7Q3S9_MORIS|nr:hypothetical protein INT43_000698 [Umbelopsis isabellina]